MKKTLIISLVFMLFLFISCASYLVNKIGLNDKSPICEKLIFKDKEVYFLGMMHLASNEFYENTRKIIADFQQRDFIFFVELVAEKNKLVDSLNLRKIRKLSGLDLSLKYSQNNNPILRNIIKKYNLIDQPKYSSLGLLNYTRIDLSPSEMINLYEKKYTPVLLDSCDLKTKLGESYNCKTNANMRNIFNEEIIFIERNKLIINAILNSNDKKIVVIYGKAHHEGIVKELKMLKNNN